MSKHVLNTRLTGALRGESVNAFVGVWLEHLPVVGGFRQ